MIGAHASISPTILTGIKYIHSIGGNAVQIFAGNNKSTLISTKQSVDMKSANEIANYLLEHDIYLAIHAIYLLNFCNYNSKSIRIKYAQDNLIYDLNLAQKIGASTVVLHVGYQKNLTSEEAYLNMASNVVFVLLKTNISAPLVSLSLETPAGQGSQIAVSLDDLSRLVKLIIKLLKEELNNNNISKEEYKLSNKRLTICVDTAHIFSGGIDIRTPSLFKDYFTKLSKEFGKRIALIHLNDSKKPLGSYRDYHEGISDGTIFSSKESKESLRYLVKWADKNKIPIILETHSAGSIKNPKGDLYAQEIGLLQNLKNGNITTTELHNWKLIHNIDSHNSKYKTHKRSIKKDHIDVLNGHILNRILILREYYSKVDKDRIRARAYSNAYLVLQNYPEEIKSGSQVEHLQGIGKQMVAKIDQLLTEGEMKIFIEIPELLSMLNKSLNSNNTKDIKITSKKTKKKTIKPNNTLNILGFGEKRIENLVSQGYSTIKKIEDGVKMGIIKLTAGEELGLRYYNDLSQPMNRNTSTALFKYIADKIISNGILDKYLATIEPAGSFPAGKKESKDLDILIFTKKYKLPASNIPNIIIKSIINLFSKDELHIYQSGNTKLMAIIIFRGIARHIDIRLLPSESEVAGRLYFTSGRQFNVMIRGFCAQQGYLLNEYGLYYRKSGIRIPLNNEEELFAKIGLPYIPLIKRRNMFHN